MKIKIIKYILIGAFLFSLAYINKNKIPAPEELKTFDFIVSSGIDIDLDAGEFSISYISSEESEAENDKSNSNKNLFNVKSSTMNKTVDKIQSLTNKSLSVSHLEYILIGENTAKKNLNYFIDYFSKSSKIRLDVNLFIIKDMSSEDFIKKILTSEIDADARLDGLVNNKNQISSMTKKNLKDIMQVFYSTDKTGVMPVLAIKESPVKNISSDDNKKEEKKYTFEFYGLGILKNGELAEYLPYSLVRSYVILTKNLKMTDIEIIDENNDLFVFSVSNSKNKISFKFDEYNIPEKVIFNVNIDTNLDETTIRDKKIIEKNMDKLNKLQSEKIKSEIEQIIEISKSTDIDFLNIGENLSVSHPYKWHDIKDEWQEIFKDIDYEINVSVKGRRK
ncbi:MAG: Ger(x)C family spore germination protein [Oscillospiraceae bacterium]|nr:Ger(x)C family spore germination protein [Oscillospiraceae bacterium]